MTRASGPCGRRRGRSCGFFRAWRGGVSPGSWALMAGAPRWLWTAGLGLHCDRGPSVAREYYSGA